MSDLLIAPDSPIAPDVTALLAAHLRFANEHSPPEDVHALDVSGLMVASISFCSARRDGVLLGIGAMKELDRGHGELKSMHTAAAARGQGIGRAMLTYLLALARQRGYVRVSLETGSMAAFDVARAMYAGAGFAPCEPFSDYVPSPNSVCMTLALS